MNYLNTGTVLGVPVVGVVVIIVLIAVVIWMLLTRSKKKEFKERNWEKEFEKFVKTTLKHLGEPKGIDYYLNGTKRGKVHRLYEYNFKNAVPALVDKMGNVTKYNLVEDKLYIWSYAQENILGKLGLANKIVIGFVDQIKSKVPYFMVEQGTYNLAPLTKNIFMFEKETKQESPAKSFTDVDTIKQLLQGQINYLPKVQFHDTHITGVISKMREQADIEREKFKGQKESAEE